MKKIVEVAVGLIFNKQQEILLAWRDEHKVPGNCWEFPGGKIETGESGYQALCRELFEEIGIEVGEAFELPSIFHSYEHVQVVLQPWQVKQYQGIPQGLEGQKIKWVSLNKLHKMILPSANKAIVRLLHSQKILVL
jgi:8-oxo-dGTP diphosphatase